MDLNEKNRCIQIVAILISSEGDCWALAEEYTPLSASLGFWGATMAKTSHVYYRV